MAELVPPHLAALIARELAVHVDDVKPHASLSGDLKADSLDIICLVVTLEDTLGIALSDADTSKLYDGTVLDVVAVVEAAQLAASPKEAVHG